MAFEPISSIIGTVVGFGSAALNGWIDLKKQEKAQAHEQRMAELGHHHRLAEYEAKAADDEHQRALEHDKLEGFRSLVRPTLTFAIVGIAILVGLAGVFGLVAGFDIPAWLNWLYIAASTILGFYFGQRSFKSNSSIRFVKGDHND